MTEDAGRSLSEFTDQDHARQRYVLIAGIGIAINILSWVIALVTPEAIADWIGFVVNLSNKAQTYLLAIPFWSTFFGAYAALRIPRYSNETAE
jgi:hypothetical protein